MERLAAVKFNNVGKFYYFSTTLDLHKGDKVVVETIRGLELGEMISELKDISEFKLNAELKPIKRKANRADVEVYSINKIKAEKSFEICKDIIEKSGLDMRLINCEYTLDASKVIFMYTADERVDFRELLKKLASVFKCRIELRQVGPRDKAKIVGGLGTCGMPLCCNSFLGEFDGVSINMAKNQLLAINIDKISGACGRLLCCLKYEDEAYTDLKKKFPRIGTRTTFEGHHVKVTGLNVISGLVKFIDEDNSVRFVSLEEFNKNQGKEKREHRPPREEKKAINEEKGHAKKQSKQEKPFKKKPNKRKPHNKQNGNRKKENVKNESRSH
jgi:cell fate regulator YaaT (PSP1 superfamily)